MFERIKEYLSERREKRYLDKYRKEAKRTQGKLEGISVRTHMARDYYEDGEYEKAAELWEEAAKIADKYPSTEEEAQKAVQGLNGYNLEGRNIVVKEALPKPTYSNGRGGGDRGRRGFGGGRPQRRY